jgi:hypothetical protein
MKPVIDPFPLRGRSIGISISAGDGGIPTGENAETFVNQLTFQTCSRYLFLGASVALGHMWRPGGILDHLVRRASEFRYSFLPPGSDGRLPPIINCLAWPDAPPHFDDDQGEWIRDFIEVRQIPPAGIPTDTLTTDSSLGKFARIRALTAMRQALVAASDFRICLGGAPGKPLRRLPGVLEEALLTYDAAKPLYLAGALGGISKTLCDVILRRRSSSNASEAFTTPPEAMALFAEFQATAPFPDLEGPSKPDSAFDALAHAQTITVEQLAERASLSVDDYLTLMTTADVGRAIQLVSVGILNAAARTK